MGRARMRGLAAALALTALAVVTGCGTPGAPGASVGASAGGANALAVAGPSSSSDPSSSTGPSVAIGPSSPASPSSRAANRALVSKAASQVSRDDLVVSIAATEFGESTGPKRTQTSDATQFSQAAVQGGAWDQRIEIKDGIETIHWGNAKLKIQFTQQLVVPTATPGQGVRLDWIGDLRDLLRSASADGADGAVRDAGAAHVGGRTARAYAIDVSRLTGPMPHLTATVEALGGGEAGLATATTPDGTPAWALVWIDPESGLPLAMALGNGPCFNREAAAAWPQQCPGGGGGEAMQIARYDYTWRARTKWDSSSLLDFPGYRTVSDTEARQRAAAAGIDFPG